MEITIKRWFGLLVASLAFCFVLVLPATKPSIRPSPYDTWPAERMVARQLSAAQRELSLYRWGQTVTNLVAQSPELQPYKISSTPDVPPGALDVVREVIESSWHDLPPYTDATIPMQVDVTIGQLSRTAEVLTPPATNGEVCAIRFGFSNRTVNENTRSSNVFWAALPAPNRIPTVGEGICAWFASYGMPGATIGEWLQVHGYSVAVSVHTSTPGEPITASRLYYDPVLYGCLAGQTARCLDLAMARLPSLYMTQPYQTRSHTVRVGNLLQLNLGGQGVHFLADLRSEIGEDRFREFWTSEQPVEEAFQAAAGQTLGTWTLAWMQRQYGVQPSGPTLQARSLGLAGLIIVLCAGSVTIMARRRVVQLGG